MENRSNLVLYDWLSFTSKTMSASDIVSLLGLDGYTWEVVKGAHGYRERLYFNAISIHYDGKEDMGVWCEMSGQGCRAFESYSAVGWEYLFRYILDHNCNITRLDVAYDDHEGKLDIDQIVEDTVKQHYISKSDYWLTHRGSTGSSLEIGSPQSMVRCRIYDKAMERHCDPGTHWIRIELQLRDARAHKFLQLVVNSDQTFPQIFSGVLVNYVRYVVPCSDSNKSRWDTAPYWLDILESLEAISIYESPGIEYNFDRACNYVFNLAGNAIDCVIEGLGIDGFIDGLKNRSIKPNPKYRQALNQIKPRKIEVCESVVIPGSDPIIKSYDDRKLEILPYILEGKKAVDSSGMRWRKCVICGKIDIDTNFGVTGGEYGICGGKCNSCF